MMLEYKLTWISLKLLTQYHISAYCTNWNGMVLEEIKNWISSFLHDRKQRVVLDGVSSPECSVLSGVPQGTALGPTLFSIYINNFPETILYSSIKLFADDCILYKAICMPDNVKKLQEDLSTFQDWQQKWLMKLNISKCHVMRVSHPRRNKLLEYITTFYLL